MAPHMLVDAGVGGGAGVGVAVGAAVGEAVDEGVGAGVGGGAGVASGMHNLHPLLVTLKSDDHIILEDGVIPDGPETPEYFVNPSISM